MKICHILSRIFKISLFYAEYEQIFTGSSPVASIDKKSQYLQGIAPKGLYLQAFRGFSFCLF